MNDDPKYYAVIGRLHGDDEDHCRLYVRRHVRDARQSFINDVRDDGQVPEADRDDSFEYANVYINQVLVSDTPIKELT